MTAHVDAPNSPFARPFYWELAEPERSAARRVALEDEGYLAHDLNHGHRLVVLADPYELCADVTDAHDDNGDPHCYSDPISAILQVALRNGHDPAAICEIALGTQRAVYDTSSGAAAHRPVVHPPTTT